MTFSFSFLSSELLYLRHIMSSSNLQCKLSNYQRNFSDDHITISAPEAGTDLDLDGAADVLHGGDARDGEGDSAPHQVRHHCEEQVNLYIYFICKLSKRRNARGNPSSFAFSLHHVTVRWIKSRSEPSSRFFREKCIKLM